MSESERSLDSICSGTVYHVSEFWIQQGFEDVPTAVDCLWVGTRNHQSMVNNLLLPSFTFQPYHYPFPILLLKGSTENNKKKQKEPQCSYLGIGLNIDCVRVCVCYSCLTLCDPMDCSPPGSSFYGILQAWILEWVAMPFSRGSSHWGTEPMSPALQEDSLPSEPPGKSKILHILLQIVGTWLFPNLKFKSDSNKITSYQKWDWSFDIFN